MRKKQKELFNALASHPDFQDKDCQKNINKLKAFVIRADKEWKVYNACWDKLYKNITRQCVSLQQFTLDEELREALRSLQSFYDRRYRKFLWDYEAAELNDSAARDSPESFSDD